MLRYFLMLYIFWSFSLFSMDVLSQEEQFLVQDFDRFLKNDFKSAANQVFRSILKQNYFSVGLICFIRALKSSNDEFIESLYRQVLNFDPKSTEGYANFFKKCAFLKKDKEDKRRDRSDEVNVEKMPKNLAFAIKKPEGSISLLRKILGNLGIQIGSQSANIPSLPQPPDFSKLKIRIRADKEGL